MKKRQQIWRVEFEVYPQLKGFSRPHCVQHESVGADYSIQGAKRRGESPNSVLKYSLSGEGTLRVGKDEYKVPQGHAFLANVFDPEVDYFHSSGRGQLWEFVFLAFNGAKSQVASINQRLGYVFPLDEHCWLVHSLLQNQEYADSIRLLSPGEAHGLVQSILSSLVDSTVLGEKSVSQHGLFGKVSTIVHDRLEQRLSLADVADVLNMSKEHLSRSFRAETGMTVLEYIQREQMRHARLLLKEQRLSVKEISGRLGFTNPSHFNRLFKRTVGMTPLEYRETGAAYM